jgi:hypothetical protein
MRCNPTKNKLLSVLLMLALFFTLMPATVWAAPATGTASGTAGYNSISISLTGTSEFSTDAAAVQNISNWTLTSPTGTQMITDITKVGNQYVRLTLSTVVQIGQTFTITAAANVFADGTEPFSAPLNVNITVPIPAKGSAITTSETKNIAVTLIGGSFGNSKVVQNKSYWTLGGTSAPGNPIDKITYIDSTHALVTLTNAIGMSDNYTITAQQAVFVNVAVAPFLLPLPVIVQPVPPDKVCEINGILYATFDAAVAEASNGDIIAILKDFENNNPITVSGKEITLNLSGHTVTVNTKLNAYSTALTVINGGKLNLSEGAGVFNVIGHSYGVWVEGTASTAMVTNAYGAEADKNVDSTGAYATAGGTLTVTGNAIGSRWGALASEAGKITIGGDAEATAPHPYDSFGAQAMSGSVITITGDAISTDRGIYASGQGSEITVCNVRSTGTDRGYGAQVESKAKVFIKGNCTVNSGSGTGIFVSSQGEVTVDGTITVKETYIKIYSDIKDGSPESRTTPTTKTGYYTYSTTNGTVWVKEIVTSDNVCAIDGTQYATLDLALAAINTGESKTITLLKNIDHTKGIVLNNIKITFALNGHTLNVISTIEGVAALVVSNGGCVYLSGEGALNVTGPARSYGVTVASNTVQSEVTVTNASSIGTESRAAHAYNKASLTVLGDVKAEGIGSFGVHVQAGAVIEVKGNVSAGNQGVCVSAATARVTGNVRADGSDVIGNPEGIGVNVYNGTAEIGGNIVANRVGAMIRAGGSITVNGTLTAPEYIRFADDAPTAADSYLAVTTKPGYRTYQHATAGIVWVKGELPTIKYDLSVINGSGDGSYAKDIVVTIIADPAPAGKQFKEWNITPTVTFTESTNKYNQSAKFIMPAQPVTATAVYEKSAYTITVQNDGNGTASADFSSAAEGAEVTLTATPNTGYRFKEWQVLSGGVTVVNNKLHVLSTDVTVKAIFEPIPTYAVTVTGGTGSGNYAEGAVVAVTADTAPPGKKFDKWVTADGVTFANENAVSTSFIMLAKAVTVKATFKDLPPEMSAVTVLNDGNGTANANVTAAKSGETVSLNTVPNSNYRFKSWEVISGGVTVTNNSFTMPGNAVTIKAIFEKIPDVAPQYKIVKGADISFKKGTASGIEIISNGDFSKFKGLKIDGVLLGTEHYTAVSGSTVVTLKAAYIQTLTVGVHTVEFVYEDGGVQTELTILVADKPEVSANPVTPQNPDTGDNTPMAWLCLLLFTSGAGILYIMLFNKKRHAIMHRSR